MLKLRKKVWLLWRKWSWCCWNISSREEEMLTIPTLILTSDTNRVELVRVRARRGRRPSNFKQQQPVSVLHSGPVGGSQFHFWNLNWKYSPMVVSDFRFDLENKKLWFFFKILFILNEIFFKKSRKVEGFLSALNSLCTAYCRLCSGRTGSSSNEGFLSSSQPTNNFGFKILQVSNIWLATA